jgi:hypothetical protein
VTETPLGLVWGARNIGRVIGRSERQTHYLLETGAIRAARKVSGKARSRWFASVPGLREQFCPDCSSNTAERDSAA